MKISFDTTVERTSIPGVEDPTPTTPNVAITAVDLARLATIICSFQNQIGEVVAWVEVVQVRFTQHVRRSEWEAAVTVILSPPFVEEKLKPSVTFLQSNIKDKGNGLRLYLGVMPVVRERFDREVRLIGGIRKVLATAAGAAHLP